jgi:predicted N-acetyltransferase YhbS
VVDSGWQVVSRWETALTEQDHAVLAALLRSAFPQFPAEFAAHRSWSLARKEARLWLADDAGHPVAHLAVERRLIDVGGTEVLVAGVGEVVVSPAVQGRGLGAALVGELRARLRTEFAADFGFLLCGEQVEGFYRRAGWSRVANPIRYLDLEDERTVREATSPTMVLPGRRAVADWPDGLADLRGLPW